MIDTFNFQKFYSKWYTIFISLSITKNSVPEQTWFVSMVVGDTFILQRMLLLHKNLITTVQYLVLFQEIDMALHHTKVCGQK